MTRWGARYETGAKEGLGVRKNFLGWSWSYKRHFDASRAPVVRVGKLDE